MPNKKNGKSSAQNDAENPESAAKKKSGEKKNKRKT